MNKINTISAAKRFAEAILADVRVYNADAIQRGDDLSHEIAEARALYQGRVKPLLFPLFEQALANSGIRAQALGVVGRHAAAATSDGKQLAWVIFGVLGLTATTVWKLLN